MMRKMFPVLKRNEGGVEIITHSRDADTNYRGNEKMFFLLKNDRLFILFMAKLHVFEVRKKETIRTGGGRL